MEITRINTYQDNRFSQAVLNQHGCFLIDEKPYEVEIISEREAIVRGSDSAFYPALIEDFRFYTPHITSFFDENRVLVKEYPQMEIFTIDIDRIQPSQFYVDMDKVKAIESFIRSGEDIIIQALPYRGGYISLDGHTRLYYAAAKGWKRVRAVAESADDWIYRFAQEARKRNVYSPKDLKPLSHEEYEEKWIGFCDAFFAREKSPQ